MQMQPWSDPQRELIIKNKNMCVFRLKFDNPSRMMLVDTNEVMPSHKSQNFLAIIVIKH